MVISSKTSDNGMGVSAYSLSSEIPINTGALVTISISLIALLIYGLFDNLARCISNIAPLITPGNFISALLKYWKIPFLNCSMVHNYIACYLPDNYKG